MATMRPVTVVIPAKSSVELAVGGKHFMLMNPKQPLKKGDVVTLKITDASGCVTTEPFKINAPTVDAGHDHSKMDHSNMKHD
jgi:copper(I)-binding protein